MAKEIDHVLVDGHWRMIQNSRVYRSAQFLNTDHRLVVATLKLQLKSGRMLPSQPRRDVGKLKDERVAEEFANRLSGDLGGLGQVRSGMGACAGAARRCVHFPPVLQRPPSGHPPGRCLAHPHLLEMLINLLQP